MIRRSFRLTLKEDKLDEYKKKHDEIWPELKQYSNQSWRKQLFYSF